MQRTPFCSENEALQRQTVCLPGFRSCAAPCRGRCPHRPVFEPILFFLCQKEKNGFELPRKERGRSKPEVHPVPPSCDSSWNWPYLPALTHLSAGDYAPHAILMMAVRQRLADTQHPVESDGSVRPSQTVTQRSGHSLERKKEPADMELSPPRQKRNASGFF